MEIILENKTKDNALITVSPYRQFLVKSEFICVVENWTLGTRLSVHTFDSTIPYNYEITNLITQEKIQVGIP